MFFVYIFWTIGVSWACIVIPYSLGLWFMKSKDIFVAGQGVVHTKVEKFRGGNIDIPS